MTCKTCEEARRKALDALMQLKLAEAVKAVKDGLAGR